MRAILCACAVSLAGCAQILGIADPTAATAGKDAAAADATGDGKIVDSDASGACAVVPVPGAVTMYPLGASAASAIVAAGQLDGDGLVDLVVGTGSAVIVLRGAGQGAFGAAHPLGDVADGVLAADIDGDGKDDLVEWRFGGTLAVRRQDGSGADGFAPAQVPAAAPPNVNVALASATIAAPGSLGAALVVDSPAGILVLLPAAGQSGGLAAGATIASPPAQLLQVIDIDGDGRDDIVYLAGTGVRVALQDHANASAFGAPQPVGGDTPVMGEGAGFGHFSSGAGRDLLIGAPSGGRLYVRGTSGTFTEQPGAVAGVDGMFLRVADVNRDGREDVISADHVTLQCAAPAAPGQFAATEALGPGFPPLLVDLDANGALDIVRAGSGTALAVQLQ